MRKGRYGGWGLREVRQDGGGREREHRIDVIALQPVHCASRLIGIASAQELTGPWLRALACVACSAVWLSPFLHGVVSHGRWERGPMCCTLSPLAVRLYPYRQCAVRRTVCRSHAASLPGRLEELLTWGYMQGLPGCVLGTGSAPLLVATAVARLLAGLGLRHTPG